MPISKNKVQFGLSQVHFASVTETEGATTYGTPAAYYGGVSLTATPNGEEMKFEADNDPNFFVNYTNSGYTTELVLSVVPDDFKVNYLGYVRDAGGTVYEDTNALSKPFALLFELQGDREPVRCIFYKCTASRPNLGAKTGREVEGQTLSMTVSKPGDSPYSFAYCRQSEDATKYAAWFTTVQQYEAPAEGGGA